MRCMYAEHIPSFSYTAVGFNSFQIKGRQKNEVNQMLTVCMSLHATYKPFYIYSISQPEVSYKQG